MSYEHWTTAEIDQLARDRDRASYVCWLLDVGVSRIFPFGPETVPDADEHFVEWTRRYVGELIENVRRAGPQAARSPEVARYLVTLHHADAVLSGQEYPSTDDWNTLGLRRGTMANLPGETYKKKAQR